MTMNASKSPLLAVSHLVIAAKDVSRMTEFFSLVFEISPHFSSSEFSEFVLPSCFRIAFFSPVGKAGLYFSTQEKKENLAIGITVKNVDLVFQKISQEPFLSLGVRTSGPPKEHSWGEKSFLLLDPEENRWEVTQSPTETGMLVNR